eukprot:Hpha_TRINITY_DN26949_c0_g1::TRINITY_DN26949_c0_g1_i1::g.24849::m.24849
MQAWLLVAAAAQLVQRDDWLVNPPSETARVVPTQTGFSLQNGLIERTFFARDGAFCTIGFRHLRSRQTFFRGISPEANITLSKRPFDIGGCLGQPETHMEFWDPDLYLTQLKRNPAALAYVNYTIAPIEELFAFTPGQRSSPTDLAWPPKGVHVVVEFAAPGAVVLVHYELYDKLPVLRKWVEVKNTGQAQVTVDTLYYEFLRAPNGAPERMSVLTEQANNPAPWDGQIKPQVGQSFPARTAQQWFFDPLYDQPNDQEIHVTYTYYTFLCIGYGVDVTFGGPTGPGVILSAGKSFVSLSVRLVLHDSQDLERQGLALRRQARALTPQLLENPIPFMITDVSSSAAMRAAVDQAADTGHELVIIGFGAAGWCGMCPAQTQNATFIKWFSQEVQYARSKGLEVSGYTLMQMNGWGESVPSSEQTLSRTGKRGPTACFATDFHDRYRSSLLEFISTVGMTGIETDGQYENIPCTDTGGDHYHNGVHGAYHFGLGATLDFNKALKVRGWYQTGADGYSYSGVNKWNHADTDAFGHLPLWEQHEVGRMYIFDSTFTCLPSSWTIGVNDLSTPSKTCANRTRVGCFDFIVGAQYMMGSITEFRAPVLWDPKDPEADELRASLSRWTAFYKRFRAPRPSGAAGLLLQDLIHIYRPDSRSVASVVHVTADSSLPSRALAAFFNPTLESRTQNLTIPLYYTGLPRGAKVRIEDETPGRSAFPPQEAVIGDAFDVVILATLPPSSYLAILCSVQ